MLDRQFDKMSIGILFGTLVPVLAFVVLYFVFEELSQMDIISSEGFSDDFRIRTIALVSIGANAILVRYFQNRYAYHAVRGVVVPTFVFIIVWIVYFSNVLL